MKFIDNQKRKYRITVTHEQIAEFLGDVDHYDDTRYMWLEKLFKEAEETK